MTAAQARPTAAQAKPSEGLAARTNTSARSEWRLLLEAQFVAATTTVARWGGRARGYSKDKVRSFDVRHDQAGR